MPPPGPTPPKGGGWKKLYRHEKLLVAWLPVTMLFSMNRFVSNQTLLRLISVPLYEQRWLLGVIMFLPLALSFEKPEKPREKRPALSTVLIAGIVLLMLFLGAEFNAMIELLQIYKENYTGYVIMAIAVVLLFFRMYALRDQELSKTRKKVTERGCLVLLVYAIPALFVFFLILVQILFIVDYFLGTYLLFNFLQ